MNKTLMTFAVATLAFSAHAATMDRTPQAAAGSGVMGSTEVLSQSSVTRARLAMDTAPSMADPTTAAAAQAGSADTRAMGAPAAQPWGLGDNEALSRSRAMRP